MKRLLFIASIAILFVQGCSKATDEENISKTQALILAENTTLLYPGRMITISNETIPSRSIIKYNWGATDQYGFETKTFKSPGYSSWLIVIWPDFNKDSIIGEEKVPHLFVNISSGNIEIKQISGMAIVPWDSDLTYTVPADGSSYWE
jgi:hypothetical protein